jgi:ribosome-associated translation inhibitor RaiA
LTQGDVNPVIRTGDTPGQIMEATMIVEISAKDLTISAASKRLIAKYDEQLQKYFRRIYSVKWSFEATRPFIEANLSVHAHSGDYRASASGMTIREVVVMARDKVERQRRRRKRIVVRARRRRPPKSALMLRSGHDS